jgi:ribosomal protein S27E
MMENKLDGNAAAGTLQEIFPFEMTLAQVTCTGCGTTNVIGATAAYMHGMGTIVRCPVCDTVLIRVVHARGRYWLDMRGVRVLEISVEALTFFLVSLPGGKKREGWFLHTLGEARTVERRRITYASNESSCSTGY